MTIRDKWRYLEEKQQILLQDKLNLLKEEILAEIKAHPVAISTQTECAVSHPPSVSYSFQKKSRDYIRLVKELYGIPGVVVAVMKDGKLVWEEGFGYADVENGVEMTPDTVLRVASISKAFTSAALALLIDQVPQCQTFSLVSWTSTHQFKNMCLRFQSNQKALSLFDISRPIHQAYVITKTTNFIQ
jgi:hypothetical protein